MFKEVIQYADGLMVFQLMAMVFFILFFLIVVYSAIKMSKKDVDEASSLPLSDGISNNNMIKGK